MILEVHHYLLNQCVKHNFTARFFVCQFGGHAAGQLSQPFVVLNQIQPKSHGGPRPSQMHTHGVINHKGRCEG